MRYRASKRDCQACPLKPRCCPRAPARKISRSIYEGARDLARAYRQDRGLSDLAAPAQKVEMLFAHLKRILKLDRLRLRGPNGARDEFHLAATAQNLRKLATLVPSSPADTGLRGQHPSSTPLAAPRLPRPDNSKTYFFNGIGQERFPRQRLSGRSVFRKRSVAVDDWASRLLGQVLS